MSDEAGGIARSQLADVWMYNSWRLRGGAGMGLPLARLYAMYFGGSLQLFPMEGHSDMAPSAPPLAVPPLGTARARLLHLFRARPAALRRRPAALGSPDTPMGKRPRHRAPRHRLGCLSELPPNLADLTAFFFYQPGYGTDAYATFNRLGDANSEHCLNAPIVAGDEDGFAPSEVRDSAPPPTRPEPGHGAVP